jgi:hypothetical protein
MQKAAYGMYKDGRIIFDEPDVDINSSRVLVVFLDKENAKVTDFFEVLGPWEDTRNADTIISDIRKSRIAKADITL